MTMSQWEDSEKAMDALYERATKYHFPRVPQVKRVIEMEETQLTDPTPPAVDVNRLRKIIRVLEVESPTKTINYAEFAHDHNFHTKASPPKKFPKKSIGRSKQLYNDVQRASINFGITRKDMKTYHQLKVSDASTVTPVSTRQLDEAVLATPPQSPTKDNTTPPSSTRKVKNSSTTTSPDAGGTVQLELDKAIGVAEMQPGVLKVPLHETRSKPAESDHFYDVKEQDGEFADAEESLSSTTLSSDNPLNDTPGDAHRSVSSKGEGIELINSPRSGIRSNNTNSSMRTNRFGSLFRKKTASVSSQSPLQKECHNVEDTLAADEEFKDFNVIPGRNLYYGGRLEFTFELPRSGMSSRSSLTSPLRKYSSMMYAGAGTSEGSPQPASSLRRERHRVGSPGISHPPSWRQRGMRSPSIQEYENWNVTSQYTPSLCDEVITEDEVIDEYAMI